MKLDFSNISYEPQEFEFGEGQMINIRPYPISEEEIIFKNEGIVFSFKNQCTKWGYCCVSWKGLIDENGKQIPCTAEMKNKMFNFKEQLGLNELINFVIKKADDLRDKKKESIKN